MIKGVIVINNHGKARLIKMYSHYSSADAMVLCSDLHRVLRDRQDTACNFIELDQATWGKETKAIYRHYATLFFVFIVDAAESELAILDLIQALTSFILIINNPTCTSPHIPPRCLLKLLTSALLMFAS
eukprot:TRINITY_DN2523_c0_g1_i3.p2 TRINITY_DN2523_c0_g1~~TRINITY_DN2523_c0_g1_i3.p2  ORF type:complete len:129 (+),score=12.48 TRINITY_DN2523_c0_g1_i3:3-389(+)